MPDKLFLRGFCMYKKKATQGLNSERALQLYEACKHHLPKDYAWMLHESRTASAPFRRNRQVTIPIRGDISEKDAKPFARAGMPTSIWRDVPCMWWQTRMSRPR
jgi:hypothetical protein